jgi:phospholipid/cholesterol/gamma-HCH transport system substrate-binding protein
MSTRLRLDRPTRRALVKLTVFTVVTLLATGLLATTIGDVGLGTSSTTYHALLTDVTGLQPGDDVRIAGVRVGRIEDIGLSGRNLADVTFRVDQPGPVLPRSIRAIVRYRNLVGQRYLVLQQGPGSGDPLPAGGTIPVAQTQPALDLTVLFDGFKPLFAALDPHDVNALASEIIQVLQGEGPGIDDLLAKVASLTSAIADRDALVGRTVSNLDTVLGTLDQRDQQLSDLVLQLQKLVSGLAADRTAIGGSLQQIAGLTVATTDLLARGRPALQADIAGLGALSANLSRNTSTVQHFLQTMPGKLDTITRTATYGSWFNFYLCDFNGRITLPTGVTYTPTYGSSTGRCVG